MFRLIKKILPWYLKAFAENNINAKIKKGVASRFVTNHDVSKEDIDTVIDVIKNVIQSA